MDSNRGIEINNSSLKDKGIEEMLSDLNESPRGGIGRNEFCVAIISRKARILYIYESRNRLI